MAEPRDRRDRMNDRRGPANDEKAELIPTPSMQAAPAGARRSRAMRPAADARGCRSARVRAAEVSASRGCERKAEVMELQMPGAPQAPWATRAANTRLSRGRYRRRGGACRRLSHRESWPPAPRTITGRAARHRRGLCERAELPRRVPRPIQARTVEATGAREAKAPGSPSRVGYAPPHRCLSLNLEANLDRNLELLYESV